MPVPVLELQRIGQSVYGTGTTSATFYWTEGVVYSTTTTIAEVTAAPNISATQLVPDSVINGEQADSGSVVFSAANGLGSTLVIDGWAITIDGGVTLHAGGNDINQNLADGATAATEWTGVLEDG